MAAVAFNSIRVVCRLVSTVLSTTSQFGLHASEVHEGIAVASKKAGTKGGVRELMAGARVPAAGAAPSTHIMGEHVVPGSIAGV